MAKKHLDVIAAMIEKDGKVLLCQRRIGDHFGGLWEFPGGKLEEGETHEEGVAREMKEELGINCDVGECVGIFEDDIPTLHIKVWLHRVTRWTGEIKDIECQDHVFVTLAQAMKFDLAPVDRKMVAAMSEKKAV